MIELRADDWFRITGRGWVATFLNDPEQLPLHIHPRELLSHHVMIDGKQYFITGVELAGFNRTKFGLLIRGER